MSFAGPIVTFWALRRMPYYCPICRESFGNTAPSKTKQRKHFQTFHPDFFKWLNQFNTIGSWLAIAGFSYVGLMVVVALVNGNDSVSVWWPLGLVAIGIATFLEGLYWHLEVRRFRRSWRGLRLPPRLTSLSPRGEGDSQLDNFLNDLDRDTLQTGKPLKQTE